MSVRRRKRTLYNKIVLLFFLLIMLMLVIKATLAIYSSKGKAESSVDVAFYLLEEQEISQTLVLEELTPNDEKHIYTFSVANNDGTRRAETSLKYSISIIMTTNLPLVCELYINDETENLFKDYKTEPDDDGTYFKTLTTTERNFTYKENMEDVYRLEISFPKEYNSVEYQGIIEALEIKIDSEQVI